MKIAKLTLDGFFNYGNVLQKYALQEILSNYAETVDSIMHEPDNFVVNTWSKQWGWKFPIKLMLNWRRCREKIFSQMHGMEMARQAKIKEWCDRFIQTRQISANLQTLNNEYDYFIVGSDQVWNPNFSNLEHCFLLFAPPEKRIAYAASISCPELPTDKMQLYRDGFANMAHISMREQQGAEMVKALSGRDVPVVFDPTLLLSPDDWQKVSRQPSWYHGGEYILTYFLGKRPDIVGRLEKKTGLPVINLLDENVYEHYVTGPDEFIWAIEHAKLVYTDSFHGTVFSILYRTPFVVCDRVGSIVSENMGSRIDTLLNYFGLESRRGTSDNDYMIVDSLLEVDWSNVEDTLARERTRADVYLQQALGLK